LKEFFLIPGEPAKKRRQISGMEVTTRPIVDNSFVKFGSELNHLSLAPGIGVGCQRGDGSLISIYSEDVADKSADPNPTDLIFEWTRATERLIHTAPHPFKQGIRIGLGRSFLRGPDLMTFACLKTFDRPSQTVKNRGPNR
jgi:hypothetical protein